MKNRVFICVLLCVMLVLVAGCAKKTANEPDNDNVTSAVDAEEDTTTEQNPFYKLLDDDQYWDKEFETTNCTVEYFFICYYSDALTKVLITRDKNATSANKKYIIHYTYGDANTSRVEQYLNSMEISEVYVTKNGTILLFSEGGRQGFGRACYLELKADGTAKELATETKQVLEDGSVRTTYRWEQTEVDEEQFNERMEGLIDKNSLTHVQWLTNTEANRKASFQ